MLDWIFEGIITWVSSVVTDLMDAVSGMFLQALGTDMTAMEEYFPFVNKAFTVMQYTAWAILFLITVWQLFRIFGGPVTDAENPWSLIGRSALFALLIGYVPTESMEPTLETGSLILGLRIFDELETGDIIIFRRDGSYLVKRIAACAGDTIDHQNSIVTVPDNCYYVLGDNAENSHDSRYWADPYVSHEDVIAKLLMPIK